MSEALLDGLFQHLRASFGDAVRLVLHEPSVLALAVQGSEIPIRIVVNDPTCPSFDVTYGKVGPDAMTLEAIQEVTAEGVLCQGVTWIVAQVVAHGAVLPEVPQPRLMRALRRATARTRSRGTRRPSGG